MPVSPEFSQHLEEVFVARNRELGGALSMGTLIPSSLATILVMCWPIGGIEKISNEVIRKTAELGWMVITALSGVSGLFVIDEINKRICEIEEDMFGNV